MSVTIFCLFYAQCDCILCFMVIFICFFCEVCGIFVMDDLLKLWGFEEYVDKFAGKLTFCSVVFQ